MTTANPYNGRPAQCIIKTTNGAIESGMRPISISYDGKLNKTFIFKIVALSLQDYNISELLGEEIAVKIWGGNIEQPKYVKGIITDMACNEITNNENYYTYALEIKPKLTRLSANFIQGVYCNAEALDIALYLLTGGIGYLHHSLEYNEDKRDIRPMVYQFDKKELKLVMSKPLTHYQVYSALFQMQQDDLSFFEYILSDNGWAYYFDHNDENMPLVITDKIEDTAPTLDVDYCSSRQNVIGLDPSIYQQNIECSSGASDHVVLGYKRTQAEGYLETTTQSQFTKRSYLNKQSKNTIKSQEGTQFYSGNLNLYHDNIQNMSKFNGRGVLFAGENIEISGSPLRTDQKGLVVKSGFEIVLDAGGTAYIQSCELAIEYIDHKTPYVPQPIILKAPQTIPGCQIYVEKSESIVDNDYNTTDRLGRYNVKMPEGVYTYNAPCIYSVEIKYPAHSGDVQFNAPLSRNTMVFIGFSNDDNYVPFIIGSSLSRENAHLTNSEDPQSYWFKDEKHNALTMYNEGAYDKEEDTGRASAVSLFSENYNNYDDSAQVRYGDTNDHDKSKGAGGIIHHSDGSYDEQHEQYSAKFLGCVDEPNQAKQYKPVVRAFSQRDISDTNPYHQVITQTMDDHSEHYVTGESEVKASQDKQNYRIEKTTSKHDVNINNDQTVQIYKNTEEHNLKGEGTTSHEHSRYDHSTDLLSQIINANYSGENKTETYIGEHNRAHGSQSNVNTADNITFNEQNTTYTTTGFNNAAGQAILNAQNVTATSSGTSTIQASKSATTKADHAVHVGKVSIVKDKAPNIQPLVKQTTQVLTFSFQARSAAKYYDKAIQEYTLNADESSNASDYISEYILGAQVKIEYTQIKNGDTDNPITISNNDIITSNGLVYFFYLGTQEKPLEYEDDTNDSYVTQLIKITLVNYGTLVKDAKVKQKPLITHINNKPLKFSNLDDVTTDADKLTMPNNEIILTKQDWEHYPATDFMNQPIVKEYHVSIGVLEPAIFFNFRQDALGVKLDQEDAEPYDQLKSYFKDDRHKSIITQIGPKTKFSKGEIESFIANGNNVTLLIHGYNVDEGKPPVDLDTSEEKTQVGTVVTMPVDITKAVVKSDSFQALSYPERLAKYYKDKGASDRQVFGSGAHKWQIAFENSVNVGAGFNGTDYSKYTRIVQICWQGNPHQPYDYMAATGICEYSAMGIFGLVQQLKDKGIKVNIAAHSLGNEVLMNVLQLLGKVQDYKDYAIDHCFHWEPAIPNNAYDTENPGYLPMCLKAGAKKIPYEYYYPDAHKGAKKITVLHSHSDNIIGAVPYTGEIYDLEKAAKALKEQSIQIMLAAPSDNMYAKEYDVNQVRNTDVDKFKPKGLSLGMVIQSICYVLGRALVDTDSTISGELLKLAGDYCYVSDEAGEQLITVAKDKLTDPNAGIAFAATTVPIAMLEPLLKQELGDDVHFKSIYELSNRMVMPVSWLIDSVDNLEFYYENICKCQSFKFKGKSYNVGDDIYKQCEQLKELVPDIYTGYENAFEAVKNLVRVLEAGAVALRSIFFAIMINKKAKQYINGKNYKLFEIFLTVVLTRLMGEDTIAAGMGYSGPEGESSRNMILVTKQMFTSDQTVPVSELPEQYQNYYPITKKDGVDYANLCVDHSAMLFPDEMMMTWIYKGQLFGRRDGAQFQFFGTYDIAKLQSTYGSAVTSGA